MCKFVIFASAASTLLPEWVIYDLIITYSFIINLWAPIWAAAASRNARLVTIVYQSMSYSAFSQIISAVHKLELLSSCNRIYRIRKDEVEIAIWPVQIVVMWQTLLIYQIKLVAVMRAKSWMQLGYLCIYKNCVNEAHCVNTLMLFVIFPPCPSDLYISKRNHKLMSVLCHNKLFVP